MAQDLLLSMQSSPVSEASVFATRLGENDIKR